MLVSDKNNCHIPENALYYTLRYLKLEDNMKTLKLLRFNSLVICFLMIFSLSVIGEAFASTFYVSPNGSDSSNGSGKAPFRTIQKAADIVGSGDRVVIKAGIYNEMVIIKSSGTSSNPIVFEGELGHNGERLTIIDKGDTVSGWVQAYEIGQGVYKTTSIGYEPYAMVIEENGETYDIAKLCQGQSSQCNKWESYMQRAPDSQEDINRVLVDFWDGIEAVYSTDGKTTYIRFRNYDDPNQKIVHSSRKGAAINIWGKSYITVKNFEIRASHSGINVSAIGGKNPASSSNITIENNKIINGARKSPWLAMTVLFETM